MIRWSFSLIEIIIYSAQQSVHPAGRQSTECLCQILKALCNLDCCIDIIPVITYDCFMII